MLKIGSVYRERGIELTMSVKGSCNCGGVVFEVTSSVSDVYVCHCSICRKSTGSGGIAIVIVNSNDLSWTEGDDLVQKWSKPGHDWETSFCRNCGSPLPGKNDEATSYIPASLLEIENSKLIVRHHLFVDSKACWEKIGDNGQQHQENFRA